MRARFKYQLAIAKLPLVKDLEDFDFTDTPINQTLVRDLAGGGFLAQQRNAVLIGGTGTGKTHLAIGVASGAKRHQMLCLRTDGVMALVAGNSAVPLAELIGYDGCAYSLDGAVVRQLVDSGTTADPRYTPSNARREARKLETQATYGDWQKEYRNLKRRRPNMSDVWYSRQIAKQDIAAGRDAETIRKHMKK